MIRIANVHASSADRTVMIGNDSIEDDVTSHEDNYISPHSAACNNGRFNPRTNTCECYRGWVDDVSQEITSDKAFCSVRKFSQADPAFTEKDWDIDSRVIILGCLIGLTILMGVLCAWIFFYTSRRNGTGERKRLRLFRQRKSRDHCDAEQPEPAECTVRENDADSSSCSGQNEPYGVANMQRRNAIYPSHPHSPTNHEDLSSTPSCSRSMHNSSLPDDTANNGSAYDAKCGEQQTQECAAPPDGPHSGSAACTDGASHHGVAAQSVACTCTHYDPAGCEDGSAVMAVSLNETCREPVYSKEGK